MGRTAMAVLATIAVLLGSCAYEGGPESADEAAQAEFDAQNDEYFEGLMREQEAADQRRIAEQSSTYVHRWESASTLVGSAATVCGPVAGVAYSGNDTFVNVGRAYPDPARFVIVIWDHGRVSMNDGDTCATGLVSLYQGVPQIEVHNMSQLVSIGR